MKEPICSCGKNSFEVSLNKAAFSKNDAKMVVCSSCGLVYGVVNNIEIDNYFKTINEKIIKLDKKLDIILAKFP